jgi:hypothetical protein
MEVPRDKEPSFAAAIRMCLPAIALADCMLDGCGRVMRAVGQSVHTRPSPPGDGGRVGGGTANPSILFTRWPAFFRQIPDCFRAVAGV